MPFLVDDEGVDVLNEVIQRSEEGLNELQLTKTVALSIEKLLEDLEFLYVEGSESGIMKKVETFAETSNSTTNKTLALSFIDTSITDFSQSIDQAEWLRTAKAMRVRGTSIIANYQELREIQEDARLRREGKGRLLLFGSIGSAIGGIFGGAMSGISSGIGAIGGMIGSGAAKIGAGMGKVMKSTGKIIHGATSKIIGGTKKIMGKSADLIGKTGKGIAKGAGKVLDKTTDIIADTSKGLAKGTGKIIKGSSKVIGKTIKGTTGGLIKVGETILDQSQDILAQTGEVISEVMTSEAVISALGKMAAQKIIEELQPPSYEVIRQQPV